MEREALLKPNLSASVSFSHPSSSQYVLCNEEHKHYLSIGKDLYQLLLLMDGTRTITEISNEYSKFYGKQADEPSIYRLITDKLAGYGVVEGFDDKVKPFEKPSYLKLSFIIFPAKLVSKVVPCFYFLLNKWNAFIVLALACILHFFVFYFYFDSTLQIESSSILIFILMGVSVTFHEIGHAASTSYYGARHGGIGGGFYLFHPVYFADVTDIWRLKKKQRLVVNVAGIYFEICFCTLLTILGLLLKIDLFIVSGLLILLSSLYNLNPLIRSDGFWVLTDLLDVPNLYKHANKLVHSIIKQKGRNIVNFKLRDYLLLVYGSFSYIFIGLLLYNVVFLNPDSVIYLPFNVYNFLKQLILEGSFSMDELFGFIMPIVFYLLVFNYVKKGILAYLENNNKRTNRNENNTEL